MSKEKLSCFSTGWLKEMIPLSPPCTCAYDCIDIPTRVGNELQRLVRVATALVRQWTWFRYETSLRFDPPVKVLLPKLSSYGYDALTIDLLLMKSTLPYQNWSESCSPKRISHPPQNNSAQLSAEQ